MAAEVEARNDGGEDYGSAGWWNGAPPREERRLKQEKSFTASHRMESARCAEEVGAGVQFGEPGIPRSSTTVHNGKSGTRFRPGALSPDSSLPEMFKTAVESASSGAT